MHYRCDSCRILNRLPLSGTTFRNIVGQGRERYRERSIRHVYGISSFFQTNKPNLQFSPLPFDLLSLEERNRTFQRSGSRINANQLDKRSPCNPRRKGFPEKGSTVFQKATGRALTIERADRHAGRLSLSLSLSPSSSFSLSASLNFAIDLDCQVHASKIILLARVFSSR